jgi:hypothetical protein
VLAGKGNVNLRSHTPCHTPYHTPATCLSKTLILIFQETRKIRMFPRPSCDSDTRIFTCPSYTEQRQPQYHLPKGSGRLWRTSLALAPGTRVAITYTSWL